jgi:crossover junction endodeoxyribonuclease RuvC
MIVLGIDPGTATTGYGFISENEAGEMTTLTYGVITTHAGATPAERLLELHQQLNKLILLHRPDTSAVEKLFFQRNVKTALAVGQARGVILMSLAECGLEVVEYTPLEIKQAVVGYGAAEKSQVQQMVQALLDLDVLPRPDDAADALAVAICHLSTARYRQAASQV